MFSPRRFRARLLASLATAAAIVDALGCHRAAGRAELPEEISTTPPFATQDPPKQPARSKHCRRGTKRVFHCALEDKSGEVSVCADEHGNPTLFYEVANVRNEIEARHAKLYVYTRPLVSYTMLRLEGGAGRYALSDEVNEEDGATQRHVELRTATGDTLVCALPLENDLWELEARGVTTVHQEYPR